MKANCENTLPYWCATLVSIATAHCCLVDRMWVRELSCVVKLPPLSLLSLGYVTPQCDCE